MAGKTNRSKLILTDDEYAELSELAKSRTSPIREVQRAKILLSYANGMSISRIRNEVNTSRPTIYLCIDKALAAGIKMGLKDIYHKPKEAVITDEAKVWIINIACTKPKDHGLAAEFWTFKELALFTRIHAPENGHDCLKNANKATVWRILNEHPIKPHKKRYYLERRDEHFEEKMKIILMIYKEVKLQNESLSIDESPDIITISSDEKTGVQAIKNVADDIPPEPEKCPTWKREHQYKRLGTLSIIAGLDLHTGHVIAVINERNRSKEFISFLKEVDQYYPTDCKIRIILDNYKTHTSKETLKYLNTRPCRFIYVHTPTHGSWLNLIESLFSKMSRTFLKEIRVDTKEELCERIIKGIDEINESPVVFRWNKFKIGNIEV
jgi:transposase